MIYTDKKFIGKTIQNIRKQAGFKQSELAELVGISEKHLSKIETGKNFPSLDNFFKMAEILKFDLSVFGVESITSENEHKQALLKIAFSASNREEIIKVFNKVLKTKSSK